MSGLSIVNLTNVLGEERCTVAALLLIRLLAAVRSGFKSSKTLRNVIVLDEAHAFMDLESNHPSGKMMVNLLETMAAEMRGLGIGLIVGGSAAVPGRAQDHRLLLHKYLHASGQSGGGSADAGADGSGRERAAGSDAAGEGADGRDHTGTGETIARIRMEFPGFKKNAGFHPGPRRLTAGLQPTGGPMPGSFCLIWNARNVRKPVRDATGLREKGRHTMEQRSTKKSRIKSEMRLPCTGSWSKYRRIAKSRDLRRQGRSVIVRLPHW